MKQLLQKIQKVSTECKSIEKDMVVGKGSYSYRAVSDYAVTLKVKEAEEKNGIVSIPISQELIKTEIIKGVKPDGKEMITYADVVKLTLRIYDIETEKFIDVESFGRGLDSGDKGFGKAATYARKYALLNAYKIATGEDPDANVSEKTETKTENQKSIDVKNYIEQNAAYKKNIFEHFGVEKTDDLTKDNFNTIHVNLTKKFLL